jgi:hypothetical protein
LKDLKPLTTLANKNDNMIEADLLYSVVMGSSSYPAKPQARAGSMNTTLWDNMFMAHAVLILL